MGFPSFPATTQLRSLDDIRLCHTVFGLLHGISFGPASLPFTFINRTLRIQYSCWPGSSSRTWTHDQISKGVRTP